MICSSIVISIEHCRINVSEGTNAQTAHSESGL